MAQIERVGADLCWFYPRWSVESASYAFYCCKHQLL